MHMNACVYFDCLRTVCAYITNYAIICVSGREGCGGESENFTSSAPKNNRRNVAQFQGEDSADVHEKVQLGPSRLSLPQVLG